MGRGNGSAETRGLPSVLLFVPRSYAPTPFCRSWDRRHARGLRWRRRRQFVSGRKGLDPELQRHGPGLVYDYRSLDVDQRAAPPAAAQRPQRDAIDLVHPIEDDQHGRRDAADLAGLSASGDLAGVHHRYRRDLVHDSAVGTGRTGYLPGPSVRDTGRLGHPHRQRRRSLDRRRERDQYRLADAGRPDRRRLRRDGRRADPELLLRRYDPRALAGGQHDV